MRLIAIPAAIGFIVSLLIHLGTFFGHGTMETAWVLHLAIFPLFIPMVLVLNQRGENNLRVIAGMLPRWAQVLGGVTMAYAMLNFGLFFMRASDGSPQQNSDGRYVISNHGHEVRTLTADEFAYRKALETRAFSGHWMVFYLVPALYFGLAYRRNEQPAA